MSNVELLQQVGINLKSHSRGSVKVVCPNCSHTRKNKTEPCLSVDIDTGMYNCHNDCGFKGRVFERKVKVYEPPVPRLEKLSPKVINWFEKERKISNNTLLRLGITESIEKMPGDGPEVTAVCFNYYRDESLVNIKFRSAAKGFKMAKNAELIFYNINAIKEGDDCVIVEGEIDCLTCHESGIYNSCSVPNGASKGQKLEYLDNCWQDFEKKSKIILAVDGDLAGIALREELARRLGKERCWTVEYPSGCKDLNEVLVRFGKGAVKQVVQDAKEWPIEGIVGMAEMYGSVIDYFQNGYPKGAKAQIQNFDEFLTFIPGQLTMVTGIPGSGKDEFVNYLMASLSKNEGWDWAVCSFEEEPPITATKLIEKFAGKAFDFRRDSLHRMNDAEFNYGVDMVDKHFHFINVDEVDVSVAGIIKKAKELVQKKGIKGLVINPWNYIEHDRPDGQSETDYVSDVLSQLIWFLKKYGVHGFLVAHPTKMYKDDKTGKYKIPTLYNINGSSNFFNKTHNGFCVYRDFETGRVDIYIQKVKFSWLGKIGYCSFTFDTYTRQYQPIIQ